MVTWILEQVCEEKEVTIWSINSCGIISYINLIQVENPELPITSVSIQDYI